MARQRVLYSFAIIQASVAILLSLSLLISPLWAAPSSTAFGILAFCRSVLLRSLLLLTAFLAVLIEPAVGKAAAPRKGFAFFNRGWLAAYTTVPNNGDRTDLGKA